MIRHIKRLSTLLFSITVLTGCNSDIVFPPGFVPNLEKYAADTGANVFFTVDTFNDPTSVTCFNGNVTMSKVGSYTWGGTANYTNDVPIHNGKNDVTCTAFKNGGSTTSNVGFIQFIPNIKPDLIMLSTQTLCGNNGAKVFNAPLVDTALTTNVIGATYTLTAGQLTLPAGVSIDPDNGHLIGTPPAGNFTINNLKMTATTAADQDESAKFTILITSAACP